MVRPVRIEYPGAWYHPPKGEGGQAVMNRGLRQNQIVRSDKDRRLFLHLLGDTCETYKVEVHAFSLMDNHYHLLVQTPEGGLARAMRHLNGVYTQKVNKRWGTDGPLFRGRYKALLIDCEEYLVELVRYIHINPVDARICTHPEDHRWTSHRYYLQKYERPSWLVTDEVLSYFGSKEKAAIKAMDEFVKAGVPKEFKRDLDRHRFILGGKGFQEWVYENFGDHEKEKKGIPLKDRCPKPKLLIKEILSQVSYAHNVPMSEIRQAQSGKKNDARSMAVYLTRRLTGKPQREIAKWVNVSNEQGVMKIQQRFKEKLTKDKGLRQRTGLIERSILSAVRL